MSQEREITPAAAKRSNLLALVQRYEGRIAQVLPQHLTVERMIALAQTEIQKTPKLLECDPGSVVGSIVQAAELGFEFGARSHAHLVPYNVKQEIDGRTRWVLRCQLIPDYRGLSFLAEQHPRVSSTPYAHVVRKGDVFDFELGDSPRVKHVPDLTREPDRSGDDVIAAYAVIPLRDGSKLIEVMARWEIDKVRASSKASKGGPWVSWFGRMARKTVLKRALNLLASSGGTERIAKALAADTAVERGMLPPTAAAVAAEIAGPVGGAAAAVSDSLGQLADDLEERAGESDDPAESYPDTPKGKRARECEQGLGMLPEGARQRIEGEHLLADGELVGLMSLTKAELDDLFAAINRALDADVAEGEGGAS